LAFGQLKDRFSGRQWVESAFNVLALAATREEQEADLFEAGLKKSSKAVLPFDPKTELTKAAGRVPVAEPQRDWQPDGPRPGKALFR
jgi:hypothetical protein